MSACVCGGGRESDCALMEEGTSVGGRGEER